MAPLPDLTTLSLEQRHKAAWSLLMADEIDGWDALSLIVWGRGAYSDDAVSMDDTQAGHKATARRSADRKATTGDAIDSRSTR